ncbi:Gfo/Idh/MocA family protein [Litchfieldia salsa]|uniref:Predicted dehydrogenase n=1 Tax=Litchfieldia salsa TaxID=930152 RepID=A0A1H0WTN7_9BACI|nr:Gfo/Idh/MocA family oxidoreductase [Litchfieldia salsa]SDP93949.1 Predicted dehydrogenase [Litchfieldia salsa]
MTLNIGIVGTGHFSKLHSSILANFSEVKIKAICGTSKEKAVAFGSEFNDVKGYGNIVEMLDVEKLDAVYVCVPPMAHGKIELELVKRNIPFFVEKPLGTNLDTPSSILKDVKKKSLITSVGYHFRYKESIQMLKSILAEQQLGMVLGQWSGSMPMVSWWRQQDGSGGQFIEQSTHIVDLVRYLCGEIEEVFGYYGNKVMHQKVEAVSVADVGTVNLKLVNGVVANISNTCILPDRISKTGLTFYTDKGIIDWTPDKLSIKTTAKTVEYIDHSNPYIAENRAFINAILTGDKSGILSTYDDAYKTQVATVGALISTEKGLPTSLSSF